MEERDIDGSLLVSGVITTWGGNSFTRIEEVSQTVTISPFVIVGDYLDLSFYNEDSSVFFGRFFAKRD